MKVWEGHGGLVVLSMKLLIQICNKEHAVDRVHDLWRGSEIESGRFV
jgi:hypothetical protein